MTNPTEITRLRQAMEDFIAARLQAKLDKEKDEDKRRRLIEAHRPPAWIADAARRVKQIQLVTHALKYTHPDARGTSLYSEGNSEAGDELIGTHTLRGRLTPDVVGNAAALDVFKFLSLEVDGKPIWQRAVENDPNLLAALPGDDEEKRSWLNAFATLPQPKNGPASHKLAKQLYWPLGGGAYHLLQPLFPSSLVQRAWERLRYDRFSEAAQQARQARREGKPYPHGYREWPELVVLKFGGTKPQNISQLNTERHGEVWLLPSRPPVWVSREITPPRHVESLFDRFGRMRSVRERLADLGRFLAGVRNREKNDRIRRGRARRVEAVIDELIQYAGAIRRLPPGWSGEPDCRLPASQRYWLDPERDDPDFRQARAATDWPRQVAESFGAWLNAYLRPSLPVGDAELRAWRREFEERLHDILQEMEA